MAYVPRQQAIYQLPATVIEIAHDLATAEQADRIVVLDKGRIVDQGTHHELLSRCTLYREICQGLAA